MQSLVSPGHVAPPVEREVDSPASGPVPAASHDEYSPLCEVVVGSAAGARIPELDRSAWLNLYPDLSRSELSAIEAGAFPRHVREEAEEDLAALAETLSGLGVTVHRPDPVDHAAPFASPHWTASGFYSYCPRDLALIVDSLIIESPSPMRARRHELAGLRGLFQERMRAGSSWIAAPPPELREQLYPLDASGRPTLGEEEPAFEAANVLRAGDDLFYLVSSSGNELGLHWLQTTLSAVGNYRVHPLRGVYAGTHLDSTISLLREGLVLLNPERIADAELLPEPLRSWEHVWCPPMTETPLTTARPPLSSAWIGMNLLMVRPDLAIVDSAQTALIRTLERRGITVLRHTLRHARVLGGGLHCVTLDMRRGHDQHPHPDLSWETILMNAPDAEPCTPAPETEVPARYAELRSPHARQVLEARSRVTDALRRSLHDTGHIEVDTPLLQHSRPSPGRSFRTETTSLTPHLYLRSSPLHLRAMLTTGLQRVCEIGRSFRDEPVDPTHSPEYTLVELYQAGADYQSLRATAQKLVCTAARAARGETVIETRDGQRLDLAQPWTVVPFYDALSAAVDEQVTPATTASRLHALAERHHVPVRPGANAEELALELYDRLVEPATTEPSVYTDFPAGPSPLAERCAHDPRLAQKWDLVVDGREIATAYTELADPDELRRRLAPDGDRVLSAEAGGIDAQWLNVFSTGMPASGGLCLGLERLLLTVTEATTVREVIPFPLPESAA